MDAGSELRRLLVEELCEIIEGWTQCDAASLLGLRQPHVSRLRRGVTDGFSVDRLVRLIASQGYHVELRLTAMERRFGSPRPQPEVRVLRFDRHGMPVRRATGSGIPPLPPVLSSRPQSLLSSRAQRGICSSGARILVRTAIDQPNPDGNPLQRAAIFVPTSYGRTLLPRLTGLLTAAADLKDQLVSEGLDPERLDADTITDIRDAQSRPLPFRQIAFIDMKELAALHRRVAPGGRW